MIMHLWTVEAGKDKKDSDDSLLISFFCEESNAYIHFPFGQRFLCPFNYRMNQFSSFSAIK